MFSRLVKGNSSEVNYEISDHQYNKRYYLADGIYLQWVEDNPHSPRWEKE
jgi:hypothetical protein